MDVHAIRESTDSRCTVVVVVDPSAPEGAPAQRVEVKVQVGGAAPGASADAVPPALAPKREGSRRWLKAAQWFAWIVVGVMVKRVMMGII